MRRGDLADLTAFITAQHIRYVIWSAADTSLPPPAMLGSPAFTAPGVQVFQLY